MQGLKEKYEKSVVPIMMERFNLKNKIAVPRIEKAVINIGFGKKAVSQTQKEREKFQDFILKNLSLITGQQPVLTISRKSVSGFKLREGIVIGAKVTLRKSKMYDFLDRLIHIALPRSRDFQGIKEKSIDKSGNLTIGIREHIIFPEISIERLEEISGFEVTIKTTTKDKEKAVELFRLLGFPIKK